MYPGGCLLCFVYDPPEQAEMSVFRDCIGPTWLKEPKSLQETAERYLPANMQQTFIDLCTQPVSHYLDR
jgi:hypothetical protein